MFGLTDALQSLVFIHPLASVVILFFATTFHYVLVLFTFFFLVRMHILKYQSSRAFLRLEHVKIFLSDMSAIIFSILGAFLLSEVLKQAINTPRPYLFEGYASNLIDLGYYASFPSSHTAVLSALAITILFSYKRPGIFLLIGALVVGFARVAAGVHFSTDIVGGFLVGLLISFLIATVRRHISNAVIS